MEVDIILVARDDWSTEEKLYLRWRGLFRVIKALNDFVYQVDEPRNELAEEVHVYRLKLVHDSSLDKEVIMSHVISSGIGMSVQRIMHLVESNAGLMV